MGIFLSSDYHLIAEDFRASLDIRFMQDRKRIGLRDA